MDRSSEDPSLWLQVSATALEAKAGLNPGAVSSHIGVDPWTVGQGAALAPAHHAHQDPAPRSHAGQGSPRVTLQEKGKLRSQPFEDLGWQPQDSSPQGGASGLGAREGGWVWAQDLDARGSGQPPAPDRRLCGPARSRHTGSPAARWAPCGARRCPRGRDGHRCERPAAAPLHPAEVARLEAALGGGRGPSESWERPGLTSVTRQAGQAALTGRRRFGSLEVALSPGVGRSGAGLPGPSPPGPRAPPPASPPGSRLPQPVTQHGVPGGGRAPGSGRQTGRMRALRGTGRRSCSSARSPRARSSEWSGGSSTLRTGSESARAEAGRRCSAPRRTRYSDGSVGLRDGGGAADRAAGPPPLARAPRRAPPQPADLGKQCAAVSTHWGAMSEPPHTCAPRCWMLACHGHCPSRASRPPTIRLDTWGCPQAAGDKADAREGDRRAWEVGGVGEAARTLRLPYLQTPASLSQQLLEELDYEFGVR